MLALSFSLLLAAQPDTGGVDGKVTGEATGENGVAVKLVATSTIAWAPGPSYKSGDGIIVVQHRKGVCATSFDEACNPGGFDKDVHTLRGVSLATGKEKWREAKHPLLLGELRNDMGDGDEKVVAIVAAALSVHRVALLDPMTGKTLATCASPPAGSGDDAHTRFQARHLDASGAFFITRRIQKSGGAPPPPVASLLLRVTMDSTGLSCALVEGEPAPPLTWPREDERVQYGGDSTRGHIDVTIDGRTRRIVSDEQPRCRRFACKPIP